MGIIGNAMQKTGKQSPPVAAYNPQQNNQAVMQSVQGIADGMNLPPPMKDMFQRAIMAATAILYDPSSHDGIMQMIQGGVKSGDVPGTLVNITLTILKQIKSKIQGDVPAALALPLGAAVLILVAELCTKSGTYPVDGQTLGKAMQTGLQTLGKFFQIPQQQLQQLSALIAQLPALSQGAEQQQQLPDDEQAEQPPDDEDDGEDQEDEKP